MSQFDRHLTTEQLSALLDDQLSGGVQSDADRAHLQTCEQCQLELAELRQTVQLLRSLPAPTLPRSFALPVDISLEQSEPEPLQDLVTDTHREQERPAPIPFTPGQARPRFGGRTVQRRTLQRTLRMVSGLVAVVGICFMLSAVLSTFSFPHMGGGASGTASSTTSNQAPSNTNNPAVSNGATTHSETRPATGGGAGSPTPTMQPTQPPKLQPATPARTVNKPASSPTFFLFDLSNNVARLDLGIILLILGLLGFLLLKQRYQR
ncbi:hypothetical protein KDA_27990 [Dictyobacter alpinus]|uniref:Zinc-finger domain-containing protein n=1 Tax=Dictyobacter alpinus TaxID=2014873 RepID=A0A402B7H7_9CHLR|nr:hypothetical protein [Dictyobacter alpinus]GCE27315.1 hypothetical protein KDA_27990 [Dictyobacter alpinus]